MLRILAALGRSLPLAIALAILACAIYFFISWRRSPARAKEVLIKVFTVLCSAIAIFFTLVSIYAIVDSNMPVFELSASCAVIGAIGLIITLICRHFFRKHNPHYRFEPTAKATPVTDMPDTLDAITKLLNWINNARKR